jgi:hypothetical protein
MAKTLGECGNIEVITDCPRLASLPYFLLAVDAKKTEHLSLVYFGVGRLEWPWAAIDFALSDKRRWPELKSVRLVTLYASAHIPIPLRSCVKRGIDVVVSRSLCRRRGLTQNPHLAGPTQGIRTLSRCMIHDTQTAVRLTDVLIQSGMLWVQRGDLGIHPDVCDAMHETKRAQYKGGSYWGERTGIDSLRARRGEDD